MPITLEHQLEIDALLESINLSQIIGHHSAAIIRVSQKDAGRLTLDEEHSLVPYVTRRFRNKLYELLSESKQREDNQAIHDHSIKIERGSETGHILPGEVDIPSKSGC